MSDVDSRARQIADAVSDAWWAAHRGGMVEIPPDADVAQGGRRRRP